MKRRLIIAALAIGALAGCTKESTQVADNGEPVAVKFSASSIATRTTEIEVDDNGTKKIADAWEKGDAIGITAGVINGITYLNMKYVSTTEESSTSTDFKASSINNSIFYQSAQATDITFTAYYPYSDKVIIQGNNQLYTVNVSDQSDLGAIDFMFASNTWKHGVDDSETPINFAFDHKLSKVVFNLTFLDEVGVKNDGTDVIKATLKDIPIEVDYNIQTGETDVTTQRDNGDIDLHTSKISSGKTTVTAILHPTGAIDSDVEFLVNDKRFTFNATPTLEAGKLYTYNLNVGRDKVDFTSDNSGVGISDWVASTVTPDDFVGDKVGDGTRENPYQIYSANDLKHIGNSTNSHKSWYGDKHYILMEDITITASDFSNGSYIPEEFYLSNGTCSDAFSGTLNGNGHTITLTNLSLLSLATYSLFSKTGTTCNISNLDIALEGGDYEPNANLCGLYMTAENYGTIENCNLKAAEEANLTRDQENAADELYICIVGTNDQSGKIIDCKVIEDNPQITCDHTQINIEIFKENNGYVTPDED